MKIAIWHDLPSGGGKRALYDHVRGLLHRGHTVESWCTSTADQEFLPLSDLCIEHVVPVATIRPGSLSAQMGKLSLGASERLSFLKAMDTHCRQCAADIDKQRFDVVLAGASGPLAVTSLATHLTTPSALYLGEPCRPLYEAPTPWPRPLADPPLTARGLHRRIFEPIAVHAYRVQARAELRGVKAYTKVLTNSQFSRESMLRAYGIEPDVCYLGVDTVRYQALGLPRKRQVIGIGTFYPHKRIEVIIRALANMTAQGARASTLTWIGNAYLDSYLKSLVHLASELGVSFVPLLRSSHDEVVRLLNEASVLAYAPRLEPFGYAPLEAAASGLPVVAKAEGGVKETVLDGQTGILVKEDAELPNALRRLLDQPELGAEMGRAGRAWVEAHWSLDEAVERLETHLAAVAARPN